AGEWGGAAQPVRADGSGGGCDGLGVPAGAGAADGADRAADSEHAGGCAGRAAASGAGGGGGGTVSGGGGGGGGLLAGRGVDGGAFRARPERADAGGPTVPDGGSGALPGGRERRVSGAAG